MNVLIACEESQRVCIAFREKGHNAFSCDIIEPSGNHPEWHIQCDVLQIINGGNFQTLDGKEHNISKWDLIIAHPPCTYLALSGNSWLNVKKYGKKAIERKEKQKQAAEFFLEFTKANCNKIAIENPIGYMNSHYKKPTQIIQPFMFGHRVRKATCLWLKNLPPLVPTKIVEYDYITSGKGNYSGAAFCVYDENGKALKYNDPRVAKERSKTFKGIALAMAEQWG